MKGCIIMFWLYLCFFDLVIAAVAFMVCEIRIESFLDMVCFIVCLMVYNLLTILLYYYAIL